MRVLYSFPNKIGAARICSIAWQQVRGLAEAGAEVIVYPGFVSRKLPATVTVQATLGVWKFRLPYRLLGRMGAARLHDRIVARRLEELVGSVDLVHCWPLGSLQTLETADRLRIPTLLERPNAHTRFCYEVVAEECRRIGVTSRHYDYVPDRKVLEREEAEFDRASRLLCPSEFTAQSFIDRGFPIEKLVRHAYGFDEAVFYPLPQRRRGRFTALFVGVDAVRKGLHLALEAWLASPASLDGAFLVAGEVGTEFKKRFAKEISNSSVSLLGHRNDVPELMRNADVLLMPSIEEGFGLVCVEAIGSGCVPLVSRACTDLCQHGHNSMVHEVRDVRTLQEQITMLYEDPALLDRLNKTCVAERLEYTWKNAGKKLLAAYESALSPSTVLSGQSDM